MYMDGPIQLVRSRSNSISSIASNTTQQLAVWSLQGNGSLLWSLHECNLKILQSTYVRVSAKWQDRQDYADSVKDFKDEVIRLRLWGREVDVKTMLVVERSKELRSAVTILLQEIASILLNRNVGHRDSKVCMLTMTGACIRPPPGWRSREYQKLRELHDQVKATTNVETIQGQHGGPDSKSASSDLELLGLEELILDLRCYTSTLMDLVPVIEHTKDVLTKYVSRQHDSKVHQMRTSAPQAPSARNDKTEVEALEEIKEFRKGTSKFKSQRHFSNHSSTIPLVHTTDDADSFKKTSRHITPNTLNRNYVTGTVTPTEKAVLPESRKPSSIASKNTTPKLDITPLNASAETAYETGPPDLRRPSSIEFITKPIINTEGYTYTRKEEGDGEASKKNGDEFSQSGERQNSEEPTDQPNYLKPSLANRRPTPPRGSPDSIAQGLATSIQTPSAIGTYPEPEVLPLSLCDMCQMPYEFCAHSLSTTYIAPYFSVDDNLERLERSVESHSSILYPRTIDSWPPAGHLSSFVGSEHDLRHQTTVQQNTAEAHIEDTYTLGDRLLQTWGETYVPGDRISMTERRTARIRRRQTPQCGGYPCTVEGCGKAFDRACELNRHKKVHLGRSERPHKCDVCGESYLYPKDLQRHRRAHTNSSQTTWLHCPHPGCTNTEGFSRRDNLLRHQRKQHPQYPVEL